MLTQKSSVKGSGKLFKAEHNQDYKVLASFIQENIKNGTSQNLKLKITPLSGADFIIALKNIKNKTITIFIND